MPFSQCPVPKTALTGQFQGGTVLIADQTQYAGDVRFAGSNIAGAADAVNCGRNPFAPFLTVGYGAEQLTTAKGNALIVLAGHSQFQPTNTILTKAGIRIRGVAMEATGRLWSLAREPRPVSPCKEPGPSSKTCSLTCAGSMR